MTPEAGVQAALTLHDPMVLDGRLVCSECYHGPAFAGRAAYPCLTVRLLTGQSDV